MEVTRGNFKSAYKILEEKLPLADFVCIDAEFSGLSTIKGPRFSFDSLEEKYEKVKNGSSEFLILQYGVALFTWNDEEKKYVALPFTFNIYPRPYKKFFNDVMFKVQSSCLDFLAQNNFDFNKMFYGGISFVHPSTKEKVKEKFDNSSKFLTNKEKRNSASKDNGTPKIKVTQTEESKVFVPKDKRDFIVEILSSVERFVIDTSLDSLDLPPCQPFERKLIYEVLEEKYPMGLYLQSEINDKKEKFVKVVKVTDKSRSLKFSENMQRESDYLNEASAFNNVMKLLAKHQKPIVGHNMLLDMFYTVTNFFAMPPDTLKEFKSLITSLFPSIFDTKVIASIQPLSGKISGTGLKSLTESIGNDLAHIDVLFDEKLQGEEGSLEAFHDAGYDALSTGKCFISLVNSLMMHFGEGEGRIDLNGKLINPFRNRIYIMGIPDVTYINIHKEDEAPSRRGVYLVNFPADWKDVELHNLFSSISKLVHPIVWVDDTSAYVTIKDKEKHEEVLQKHVHNNKYSDLFKVTPFADEKPPLDNTFDSSAKALKRKHSESDQEDGEISSSGDEDGERKKPEPKKPAPKKPALFQVSTEW